jgi:putative N6-adenine-specific DNA methylase
VISADIFHSQITNSQFATLRAKDAIADHYRAKKLTRPSVNKENTDIYINVHISHDVCTVSLDSSGESLHKRGYKIAADKAPLNEVLAAGMIQLAGWKGDTDFYDPMCGSGTITLEAAMLAMNIPAGYYRKDFVFQKWLDFDEKLWQNIKEAADADFKDIDIHIVAADRSEKAVQIAKKNLKHAGLHKDIELVKSYFDALTPKSKKGLLIFNPPYGMRLTEKDIVKVYQDIGDVLKKNWAGHQAWIITSEQKAAKFIGLHPSKKIKLYNGPKEAQFLCFEVYEGSKKEKKKFQGKKEFKQDYRKKSFGTKRKKRD